MSKLKWRQSAFHIHPCARPVSNPRQADVFAGLPGQHLVATTVKRVLDRLRRA